MKRPEEIKPRTGISGNCDMTEDEIYRDPLYWGAFIYEGDPGLAPRSTQYEQSGSRP